LLIEGGKRKRKNKEMTQTLRVALDGAIAGAKDA